MKCEKCGAEYQSGYLYCPPCSVRFVAHQRREFVEHNLYWSGLSSRELRSNPTPFSDSLAERFGINGFGLHGNTGTGKTFTMVSAIRRVLERCAEREDGFEGGADPHRRKLLWVPWPVQASEWRGRGFPSESERDAQDMIHIPILVLDDLGAERFKGDYSQDWVLAALDRIVDARYRAEKPIWWTSNLSPSGLVNIYGSRMFSRLGGPNRAVAMPDGPDQRFAS